MKANLNVTNEMTKKLETKTLRAQLHLRASLISEGNHIIVSSSSHEWINIIIIFNKLKHRTDLKA